jgi:hypothetical protein
VSYTKQEIAYPLECTPVFFGGVRVAHLLGFVYGVLLRVFTLLVPCCDVRYDFRIQTRAHVLFTVLLAHSGVKHTLAKLGCGFVLFFFVLCTHVMPGSLDCPFFIIPSVFSYVYLLFKTKKYRNRQPR